MKVQELFPIGSVVKLRNGIRPLMIFGIKQTNLETNEEYDYIGVLYPEGNMGNKNFYLIMKILRKSSQKVIQTKHGKIL